MLVHETRLVAFSQELPYIQERASKKTNQVSAAGTAFRRLQENKEKRVDGWVERGKGTMKGGGMG